MQVAQLPEGFSFQHGERLDKKLGLVPRLQVRYLGVVIALFEFESLEERAIEFIKTYGYLAEWMRLKLVTGTQPNWVEELRVDIGAFNP